MTSFSELGLKKPLMQAVAAEGYTTPTPIQAQSIPYLLQGRDLIGLAQTGTGKTAAFTLPMLHRLSESERRRQNNSPRALVLAPTRELAGQIADSIRTYGHKLEMRYGVVFGGVPINPQIKMLNRGLDILVATPGRLLDLMNQGKCRLDRVEIFILDEGDRMLDMGFIHDVKKIISKVPKDRQTGLFSATMPKTVVKLADELLRDPVSVEVAPAATTAERVDQRVLFVPKDKKRALLTQLLGGDDFKRVLVFSRTKHGANKITEHLERAGIDAAAIHGNKSQTARQRALDGFKSGRIRALVATDIAARGIDVEEVTHVINFDLPNEPESYVHRIGRTARAGASGKAISFCDVTERDFLRDIEKTIRQPVPVDEDHPYHFVMPTGSVDAKQRPGGNRNRNSNKKRGRGRRARGPQSARQAA